MEKIFGLVRSADDFLKDPFTKRPRDVLRLVTTIRPGTPFVHLEPLPAVSTGREAADRLLLPGHQTLRKRHGIDGGLAVSIDAAPIGPLLIDGPARQSRSR